MCWHLQYRLKSTFSAHMLSIVNLHSLHLYNRQSHDRPACGIHTRLLLGSPEFLAEAAVLFELNASALA